MKKKDVKNAEPPTEVTRIDIRDENMLDIAYDISSEHKKEIQQVVQNYVPNKIKMTNVEMNLVVRGDNSIYHRPRRLPFIEKEIVVKQVEEWIEQGIVESDFFSQVVVVRKKDGTPRVCIDYWKLNRNLVKDRFPLPLIEDVLDHLQGACVFSTLDLKNGFLHVDVNKDSRCYTSFITHNGLFQFLKVPFGLYIAVGISAFCKYCFQVIDE